MSDYERSKFITADDYRLFDEQDKETLAEWWVDLNHWKWPDMISDEEPARDELGNFLVGDTRRGLLMDVIEGKVGHRLCLWAGNKRRGVPKNEFDDFYDGHFCQDMEALKRNQQRSIEKFDLPKDFFDDPKNMLPWVRKLND